jgi:hypothetical protein
LLGRSDTFLWGVRVLGAQRGRQSGAAAAAAAATGGAGSDRHALRGGAAEGEGAARVLEKVGVAVVVGRRSWVARLSCAVGGCPCDVGSMQAVLALACGLACDATRPVQRTAEGGRGERQGQRQSEASMGRAKGVSRAAMGVLDGLGRDSWEPTGSLVTR